MSNATCSSPRLTSLGSIPYSASMSAPAQKRAARAGQDDDANIVVVGRGLHRRGVRSRSMMPSTAFMRSGRLSVMVAILSLTS